LDQLPAVGVYLLQFSIIAPAGFIWYWLSTGTTTALAASLVLWVASLGDIASLRWLHYRQISFGPWKSQVVVLLVPRTSMAFILALLIPILGSEPAFALLLLGQLSGSALLWWATAIEARRLALTHLDVHLSTLPPGTEPIRLLHISDIHLERFAEREMRLLSLAREAAPDIIVITGDYLNLSYNDDRVAQEQVARLLGQLHAPHGIYATLGSPPVDLRHEIVPLLGSVPLRLLRDEWATVDVGDGTKLVLIGLDCTHHLHEDGERLARVAATAPNGAPRVLLYHSPELMPQASSQNIDLYLCGHTHGGQVRLPFLGPLLTSSQLGRRYVMGHYRQADTHLYVSRGIGLEGLSAPRVRLLSPPEVTLVTLHPREAR
jgi:predicted MPP superfamily phosphohydrolase